MSSDTSPVPAAVDPDSAADEDADCRHAAALLRSQHLRWVITPAAAGPLTPRADQPRTSGFHDHVVDWGRYPCQIDHVIMKKPTGGGTATGEKEGATVVMAGVGAIRMLSGRGRATAAG